MCRIVRYFAVSLLSLSAACADRATPVTLPPDRLEPPTPLGVYEISVTGIGSSEARSTVSLAKTSGGSGASRSLSPVSGSIVFEQVASSSFTEGTRTGGGQRYISFTYRVHNGTGVALSNLTMLMVSRTGTITGTPLSSLKRFDGTSADPAIAPYVVPTGAVAMRSDLVTMQALDPDVIQVFQESEVAGIPPPGDVTGIFPYGYVVRSAASNAVNRMLPVATSANQYDGVMTLSFRLPLQATSSADVFSLAFQVLAVEDSETRLTESVEEAQDTSAVRRLRERAVALGATMVTVLAGSSAAGPDVPDYLGQRQICTVRTAGSASSPVTYLNTPASYTRLEMLLPGESYSPCGAGFRSGIATRPVVNSPYSITVKAMDRYGNVITSAVDTMHLTQTSGPAATFGPAAALVGGEASLSVTYQATGSSRLTAVGKRLRGRRSVEFTTPATVVAIAGNNQAAMAGSVVSVPPAVLVRDLANNPLSGIPVTFTVTSGGGYVFGASVLTNANGVATAGSWMLGSPGALNTLSATAAGASAPAAFKASGCSGGGGTGYGITLCFTSTLTASQRAAFEAAAARWQSVITGDLPDVDVNIGLGECSTTSPSYSGPVDDLMVFVGIEPFELFLEYEQRASFCRNRSPGPLPYLGFIRINPAEAAAFETAGVFPGVVLHEMGHVVGIGHGWWFGWLGNPTWGPDGPSDTYFSGSGAIAAFNQIGGTYYSGRKVPVENSLPVDGLGLNNSHWRESVFGNELMTGYANPGYMPLSLVTVRSLADMGYQVNTAAADPFFLPPAGVAPGPVPLDNPSIYNSDAQARSVRIR